MDWRETPSIQNHQSLHTPRPEWVDDQEWTWPFWKFAALFKTLMAGISTAPQSMGEDENTTSWRALTLGNPSGKTRLVWVNFVRVSRNFSYDSFVGYFGAYIKDKPESTPTLADNQGPKSERQQQPPRRKEAEIDRKDEASTQEKGLEQRR
ncbi:hypothetical protein F5B21DRAFT_525495 [Xylaria acuta]|nr:hypothetical protein F5B21DRAFT_525495 [Xylaria acuta]